MAVWLCSWIGVTLFHGLSHAAHAGDHASAPCVVCQLLDQPVPATIDTRLALSSTPVFDWVDHIDAETVAFSPQHFPRNVVPRGPPALLFV